MLVATNLSANVNYIKGSTNKTKWATEIEVYMGNLKLASLTIGGRYSKNQAIAEFKKNPSNFIPANGILKETVKIAAESFKAAA